MEKSKIKIDNLITDFEILHKKNVFSNISKMKNSNNFLDILEITRNEIVHSNFLAWLFNPKANHGLNYSFMKPFFDYLQIPIVSYNTGDFVIIREKGLETKFIDILILSKQNKLLVAIENKICNTEYENQLANYYNPIEKYYSNYPNRFYIYLTPIGDPPSSNKWHSASYIMIIKVLEQLLESNNKLSKKVMLLIDDYLTILRRDIVVSDPNIIKNWKDVYRIYFGENGKYIYEFRKEIDDVLNKHIFDLMKKNKEKYHITGIEKIKTGDGLRFRFITDKLDVYSKKVLKQNQNRIIFFDIWVFATKPKYRKQRDIVLVELRTKSSLKNLENKDKIIDLIRKNNDIFQMPSKGNGFYFKYLWDLKDYKGLEQMKSEVELILCNFLDRDLKEIEKRLCAD